MHTFAVTHQQMRRRTHRHTKGSKCIVDTIQCMFTTYLNAGGVGGCWLWAAYFKFCSQGPATGHRRPQRARQRGGDVPGLLLPGQCFNFLGNKGVFHQTPKKLNLLQEGQQQPRVSGGMRRGRRETWRAPCFCFCFKVFGWVVGSPRGGRLAGGWKGAVPDLRVSKFVERRERRSYHEFCKDSSKRNL